MGGTVSTYGWDVVFATRASIVNAGLAQVGVQSFDEVVQHSGVSVHARGDTGRWQITSGGSGSLVNFTVPCPTLTLSDSHKSFDFTSGQFQLQGTLRLQAPDGADDDRRELVVSAGPGALTVLSASFPQSGFGAFEVYAKAALQAWLDAQASFPYVLADVHLSGSGEVTLDRALAPATASYAYADAPGGGVLGILSTVADGTAPDAPLLQEVSPDAVSDAGTVVLVSEGIVQRLANGAGASVTLPGTSGSTCQVDALASFPVIPRRPGTLDLAISPRPEALGQAVSDSGLKADTYGWDTVFAIRADDVNASIKRLATSPTTFSGSTTDPATHKSVQVSGGFSDWHITLGGSGKLLNMRTPVTSLVASGTTAGGQPLTFTFGPGSFEIQVELEYVPHTDPPADASGTFHNLVVKASPEAPAEQVVTVLGGYDFGTSTDEHKLPFADVADDVIAAMQTWFNDHLGDFEHVFATVNLNRTADQGQFAWLLPTYTSYAFVDGPTLDESVLGILCMTGGRPATGLDQEVSPNAIPAGSRAGFLIAPERFIAEMLWPSMPLVYAGAKPADFAPRTDGTGLTLAKGPVTIKDMVDDDGNPHTTVLQNLEVSTADATLTIDATTSVEVSPGIQAFTHNTVAYTMALHQVSPTVQTIFYVQDGKAVVEHWTEESEGVAITKILAGIAAALIAIVIGVLTDGAGFVIAALVLGVLVGVGDKVPDIIAAANTDDSPSVSLLTFNAVDPLQWSDQKDFTLDQVALNYSLQMGGTAHFGGS